MSALSVEPLVLVNRHTGETLRLTRFESDAGPWLEIKGSLPPHSEGPPLHIHKFEDEGGRIIAGTISARVGKRVLTADAGGELFLPRGEPHRWWNGGDTELVFEGFARPIVDFDRWLQALFEVVNAGPPGRPPLFYMAHVLHRHRRTQTPLLMPRLVQGMFFRVIILIGRLLGRYRGSSWPGAPERCPGAPVALRESA